MSFLEKLKEDLAKEHHDIWSDWMKFLFQHGEFSEEGEFTISSEKVRRWRRQMVTDYEDLSEQEKASDRYLAGRTVEVLKKASPEIIQDLLSA